MNSSPVDIIICTHNNEEIIEKCLDHVMALKYENKKCIIIDDVSTDRTVEVINQTHPGVRIIQKKERSGPSVSRNIAIKNSSSNYLLFLDSDVFVEPYFLYNLMEAMGNTHIRVSIFGGKLLLPNETIDSVGGEITKIGVGFDRGHGKSENEYKDRMEVMYIPSAAILIRREVFDKIGLFDETYFYGHEDTDFCWRAHIAGFKAYYEPSAIAHHSKNTTVKNMQNYIYYYGVRNRIRSMLKNHQPFNLLLYGSLYKLYLFADILIRSHKKEKIKALFWNFKNIKSTLKERQKIQPLLLK